MVDVQLTALLEAIRIAGSQVALARQCGVAQPTVWKWVHQSKRVSAEFVLSIEAATGISRHELRPDIYPIEDPVAVGGEAARESAPADPKSPAGADTTDCLEGQRA